MELVAIAEITELLGYGSRQGADYAIKHSADFPLPLDTISAGRIWKRSDVVRWMERHPEAVKTPKPMRKDPVKSGKDRASAKRPRI